MELFLGVTGIQPTTLSSPVVKTASTECGTSMEDNSITHLHTTMLSLASSGHQMVTTLLSDLLKCSDSVTNLDGLTPLINHRAAPF